MFIANCSLAPGRLTKMVRLLFIWTICLFLGCGTNVNYPIAGSSTFIGKPGHCFVCRKEISNVGSNQIIDHQGIRYVVCDKNCESQISTEEQHAH